MEQIPQGYNKSSEYVKNYVNIIVMLNTSNKTLQILNTLELNRGMLISLCVGVVIRKGWE